MPVDLTHPEYDYFFEEWLKCRDIIEGSAAVKKATTKYLPKLEAQEPAQYTDYLAAAIFYNIVGVAAESYLGMIFNKDPEIKAPVILKALVDDANNAGESLIEFLREAAEEVFTTGRFGIYVDFPEAKEVTDLPAQKARPYFCAYQSEQITNWRTQSIDGKKTLTQVVLKECVKVPNEDGFGDGDKIQFRVLLLSNGKFMVEIWEPKDPNFIPDSSANKAGSNQTGGSQANVFERTKQYMPVVRGKPLDFIPFVCVGKNGTCIDVQRPPLLDMTEINIGHYRNSARYEHALSFCVPTLFAAGFPDDEEIYVGSSRAMVTANPDAKMGYAEFTGAGLEPLRQAMVDKVERMVSMGARMLEPQKKQAESGEALSIRSAAETSVVGQIAKGIADAVEMALQYAASYLGSTEQSSVELNASYDHTMLDYNMVNALSNLNSKGQMSMETFLWNLKSGNLMPGETDIADEKSLIEIQGPSLLEMGKLKQPAAPPKPPAKKAV